MIRTLTLCALYAFGVHGLAAGQTETTTVNVSLGLVAVYDPPTCSISAGGATVDFGTVTSPRSSRLQVTSSGLSVTITGTSVTSVAVDLEHPSVFVSGSMENSDGGRIGYTTALSPANCGCANSGGSIRTITCTCDISGYATIPVQAAAGSYSGTSTLSATCTQ